MDRDVIDLLRGEKTEADLSILNLLKDGGHLTELTPQEEIHHIAAMYKKYMETHPIMNQHMIIITYNCNLHMIPGGSRQMAQGPLKRLWPG